MSTKPQILDSEHLDILQEIMNIAFGKAAADLAEVINIFVMLSVPDIRILISEQLRDYLQGEIKTSDNIFMIEQNFWGKFSGNAYLVFPAGAGREFLSLIGSGDELLNDDESMEMLESETLMEIGNILIGACVGKIAELLGDILSYSPPQVLLNNLPTDLLPNGMLAENAAAIVLKTVFCFNDQNVNGFLFMVTSQSSVEWLKSALDDFMSQYA